MIINKFYSTSTAGDLRQSSGDRKGILQAIFLTQIAIASRETIEIARSALDNVFAFPLFLSAGSELCSDLTEGCSGAASTTGALCTAKIEPWTIGSSLLATVDASGAAEDSVTTSVAGSLAATVDSGATDGTSTATAVDDSTATTNSAIVEGNEAKVVSMLTVDSTSDFFSSDLSPEFSALLSR